MVRKSKSKVRKVIKWLSITVLSVVLLISLVIGIAVNFIFTPSKLTPMVAKVAKEYLNADVTIGEIELTFFSTFPEFGLRISEMGIVSNVMRDTSRIVRRDSLMYIEGCLLTVDPVAYLKENKIDVKELVLDKPQIYGYVDTAGNANWNIYDIVSDTITKQDTVVVKSEERPMAFDIKNIRINNGRITYNDKSEQVFTRINGLDLVLNGSFMGRTADLDMDLKTKSISIRYKRQTFARRLSFGVKTKMSVDRDSLLFKFRRTVFDLNGIKLAGGGTLQGDSVNRNVKIDVRYGINIPSLHTLLDMVPATFLDKNHGVDVKGSVLCKGKISGFYGRNDMPTITSQFTIADGYVAYAGMPAKIDELALGLNVLVDLQHKDKSYVNLDNLKVRGGDIRLDMSGKVQNVLEDPVIEAGIDANVNFEEVTRIFPLVDGITLKGVLGTSLKTNFRLADALDADYGKIKVRGWCRVDDIDIFIPTDSIIANIKSANVRFTTNRQNDRTLQGSDLLSGIFICSDLNFNVKQKLTLQVDTTYLTFRTTQLKDTAAVADISSRLGIGRTVLMVRDTLLLGLKKAEVKARLMPSKRNKRIPTVSAEFKMDSLRLQMLNNRLNLAKANVFLEATRSRRNDSVWIPKGYIDFQGMRAYTPYFPLRIRMPGTRIHFDRREFSLDSAVIRLGRSDLYMTGKIYNFYRSFMKKDKFRAELNVYSKQLNLNQIMRALDAGTAYAHKVETGYSEKLNSTEDDMDKLETISDTDVYEGSSSVFVIPPGIEFKLNTQIDKMLFGKLEITDMHGGVEIKDQKIKASNLRMRSAAANMDATLVYEAKDTTRAYTGMALNMHDIQIDSLVRVIPSLDSLFPMLASFEGNVDFNIAGDTWLDSDFNVELPTLRAAAYLDGTDLVLMDGETFAEISKMLMFKNKKRNLIDTISVSLRVHDGEVEIFPFLLEIDRYKVAIGGKHNVDMTFNYHVSLLKSPLPFRAGVDVKGSLEKMKFRITKAKYKDLFIPSRRAKIDSAQINLQHQIRQILREGY